VSRRREPLRALIIEHERVTPAGLIYEWLEREAAEVDELRIDVEKRGVDPTDYDLLIPLGSEHPPYADHIPWILSEVELLRRAHASDVSVLGICFGGQLLARSLGGRCHRAKESEIGWLYVQSHEPELIPQGPWFQWHFDTFEPPPGATLLAESGVGPQAYSIGRSLGLQFHPEVTPEIMEQWVQAYRHELDADGVDPDALLTETYERMQTHRASSLKLFRAFLERVAERGGSG
jgi:GMP synthase-like glutamine amidotransferase